ncbi:hypothetical protein D3C73_987320 [compost metagenome]
MQGLAPAIAPAALADHHIQAVVVQQFVELAGDADGQVQLDFRMRQTERGQHIGQRAHGQIVRRAEPHAAAQARRIKQTFGAFVRVQDDLGMNEQAAAVAGQHQRMGVTQEQAPVDRLFQLPDMFADGGLGQPEAAGGFRETGSGRRGGEGLEPEGIQHGERGLVIMISDDS